MASQRTGNLIRRYVSTNRICNSNNGWTKATTGTGTTGRYHQTKFNRSFSYASVNHDVEYKNEIDGRHGDQLKLALEEGKKYEKEKVDPFELYKIDDLIREEEEGDDHDDDDDPGAGEGYYEEEDDEEDDDDDDDEEESKYGRDGHVRRTKAELVSYKAGAPAGGKFAIVDFNGSHQQKVTVDDIVIVNKLKPVDKWSVGSTLTLTADDGHVLLLGSQEKTLVGLPYVNGGEVDVMVEEITRDKKVIIFKKKRRKNYRRKNGFKREVTFLRILDIRFPSNE